MSENIYQDIGHLIYAQARLEDGIGALVGMLGGALAHDARLDTLLVQLEPLLHALPASGAQKIVFEQFVAKLQRVSEVTALVMISPDGLSAEEAARYAQLALEAQDEMALVRGEVEAITGLA
jgi:hypothetical protein